MPTLRASRDSATTPIRVAPLAASNDARAHPSLNGALRLCRHRAVAAFAALAIAGFASSDLDVVRGAYLTMELTGWFVLVPLALTSLVTGLVQSLGTKWGLFRHYWVVFKLAINVAASVILIAYMQTLAHLADVARSTSDVGTLRSGSPLLHSIAALVLLLVALTLGIYKPRGLTPYGQRKQRLRV